MTKVTKNGLTRRASHIVGRGRTALGNLITTGSIHGFRSLHCADFHAYVSRLGGRQNSGFPDHWRVEEGLVSPDPARVAVVIHCFYPELMDELFEALTVIPVDFDLFVTNASQTPVTVPHERLPRLGHAAVIDVDNHGRDIFPTVQLVNAGFLNPYEIILKIHTKKSPWREEHAQLAGDGAAWKDQFLRDLLGSSTQVERILDAFASDASLGLVTADDTIVGPEFWGGDQRIVTELLKRLEMSMEPQDLRFASGSMYWTRGFVLQGLRALNLQAADFEVEDGQVDGTTAHGVERLIGVLTQEAGLRLAEAGQVIAAAAPEDAGTHERFARQAQRHARAQVIPFYLPQFHDSPQNNRWWGQGFTEWSNVTAAVPGYRGHYQPKLPTELGFYDLADDAVRVKQADLAREHGLAGFMYYYYWFSGQRLLNVPIERLRASDLDQPYCIMWANENWTRRWDGRAADILIGQDYSKVPAQTFIDDVMEFLLDPRYMRIDGKALLAVYRPMQMENFPEVVQAWRDRARQAGVGELYVLAVAVAAEFDGITSASQDTGIDGTLQFPPHNLPWVAGPASKVSLDSRWRGNFMSYQETVKASLALSGALEDNEYPGAMVAFDNAARRQWTADTWYGSNPYTFRRWVAGLIDSVMPRDPEHRVVFINAWNEWAESAVLEPTTRFGRTFLLALRDAIWS